MWDGVNFAIETGVGTREDQVENPVDFIISLRLTVRNDDGKECPYLFDLEAVALIQLAQSVPAEKREELAEVNGLAITYGAMREMLVGLTSRMEYGALVLPGVNFQDHVKGGTPDGAGRQLTKKAPSTKRLPSAEPASPPGSPTV